MSFTKRDLIFKDAVDKIRDTIARPSLDTFYQVDFAFGKTSNWLSSLKTTGSKFGTAQGQNRTQGRGLEQKMSLLCTQAELPGTSFVESTAIGHRQGIQESFPNLRNFPPLNLVFYVDADHVILEVLESWMTYINPIFSSDSDVNNGFSRFNYPDDYKEVVRVTKFERDTFIKESRNASYQSDLTCYKFKNVWPRNMTSMRVAYGDSNVLRCNLELAYDRFITSFNYKDTQKTVLNSSSGVVNSNDILSVTQTYTPSTVPSHLEADLKGINVDDASNDPYQQFIP